MVVHRMDEPPLSSWTDASRTAGWFGSMCERHGRREPEGSMRHAAGMIAKRVPRVGKRRIGLPVGEAGWKAMHRAWEPGPSSFVHRRGPRPAAARTGRGDRGPDSGRSQKERERSRAPARKTLKDWVDLEHHLQAEADGARGLEGSRPEEVGIVGRAAFIHQLGEPLWLRRETFKEAFLRGVALGVPEDVGDVVQVGSVVNTGGGIRVEEVDDVHAELELHLANLERMGDQQVELADAGRGSEVAATVGVELDSPPLGLGRERAARPPESGEADRGVEGGPVGSRHLDRVRTIGGEVAFDARCHSGRTCCEPRRRPGSCSGWSGRLRRDLVGAREAGVVAGELAVGVGGPDREVVGEAAVVDELESLVVADRLGLRRDGAGAVRVARDDPLARVAGDVDLVAVRVEEADVLDGVHELLVDVPGADDRVLRQLVLEPELVLLVLHRPQVRVDVLGVRGGREAEVTGRQRAEAGDVRAGVDARVVRRDRAAGRNALPVERVERVEVGDPLVGAEGATRHRELRDVVVRALAAVRLRLLLAADVPGEAEARGELVAEVELDRVLGERRVLLVAVVRDPLLLRADADVQREERGDVPGVLDEEADVRRLGRAHGPEMRGRAREP